MSATAPRAAGVELAHDRWGTGPTLVLLHPLGADRRVWQPVAERLGAERSVIAVDLPGFGDSPAYESDPPTQPDPRTLARAMAATLRELAPDGYHVAGNSLGGWIALELAAAGEARSVTAIAPAGLWPQPLAPKRGIARAIAKGLLPLMPAATRTARGRRIALAGTMAHPEIVPPDAALGLVRAYALAPGFAEVNAAMRAGTFRGLERIRVPVTLAWPEHDRLVARPAHLPPNTRNIALPGCGHVPMWDDPERVAAVLLSGSLR